MTQEEKELLFKDLCARTPYGVIVRNIRLDFDGYVMSPANYQPICVLTYDLHGAEDQGISPIEDIRPYLRPMSSMTEEEKENLQSLHDIISNENYGDGYSPSAWDAITEWEDYCNSRHLDYRGLIKKGLALEAPEDMYKNG